MNLLSDLFRGMVVLSFIAVAQQSCSVKDMARHAAKAHKKGLTSYGEYSRNLTGSQKSWARPKSQ